MTFNIEAAVAKAQRNIAVAIHNKAVDFVIEDAVARLTAEFSVSHIAQLPACIAEVRSGISLTKRSFES